MYAEKNSSGEIENFVPPRGVHHAGRRFALGQRDARFKIHFQFCGSGEGDGKRLMQFEFM